VSSTVTVTVRRATLQIIHGDSDWIQEVSRCSGGDNTRVDHARQGQAEAIIIFKFAIRPFIEWAEKPEFQDSDHTAVPLGWVESGLGRKSRLC
jgi:hypothetical protein